MIRELSKPADESLRERMDIVVIGHVDHGKSTLVGRLLADTGTLPEGKLEAVKANCRRNAKPFEYAFLLDALKDEQAQGITIDSARCFFKSARRDYIIIDAPGHLEFLRNMISGAARAEAGLLLIDVKEGVKENSRRHGFLMSLLGIRQIAVCVNKMDLVGYSRQAFEDVRRQYEAFLAEVGITARAFIPIAAREGDNIVTRSAAMPWYEGPTILEMVELFEKEPPAINKPLRLPVQDIYKFTEEGDDRRVVAGRIETGSLAVGDEVVFLPSGKRSRIATVEGFNLPPQTAAQAGQSTGVTLTTQVYVRPGEVLCKAREAPAQVTTQLRVTLFWLGRAPMIQGKRYKLKLAQARVPVWLTRIDSVLDASTLAEQAGRRQVERHDVAQCVLETLKPVACDLAAEIAQTGRFVIIDNYEIAGGGIILNAAPAEESLAARHVRAREKAWDRSRITVQMRAQAHGHRSALIVITGAPGAGKATFAKALEERLFAEGRKVYYLGISSRLEGIDSDLNEAPEREEYLRRMGETAHLFTDAGMILITTISDLDDQELEIIQTLNAPGELLVIAVGQTALSARRPDLHLASVREHERAITETQELLTAKNFLPEYFL